MTNTPAQQKRMDAINAIVTMWHEGDADRSTVREHIAAIYNMGRTDRWHNAICRWSEMVKDIENPLDWAVLQGAVFATHAA